jgi:hypothetical protein
MIELKVQCDCGQKYKFDVEPVNGQMPFRVNCPICHLDGTAKANQLLQAMPPAPMIAPPPVPPPVPAQLHPRLGLAAAPIAALAPAVPTPQRFPATAGVPRGALGAGAPKKVAGTTNLGLGAVGALVGAGAGAALMYAFYALADLRFPLMGTGIGLLTGLGARIFYRGTDNALGAISGGIAAVSVVGTLYMMYGEFPIISIITVLVSISFAYRLAA